MEESQNIFFMNSFKNGETLKESPVKNREKLIKEFYTKRPNHGLVS